MDDFHNLLQALMSHDNSTRGGAEAAYNGVKASDPSTLLSCLATTVHECERLELRAFAAVLLRRASAAVWQNPAFSADAKEAVKAALLGSLQSETEGHIRNKVADTVSSVAFAVFNVDDGHEWPELLPFLLQCCQAPEAPFRESALTIVGKLVEWMQSLAAEEATFKEIFAANLGADAGPGPRLAALRAVCKFVPALDNSASFGDLMAPMVQVAADALTGGDEERGRAAFEELIELVEVDVKFMRPQIEAIGQMTLEICQSESLQESTRHMGLEFLLSLAEQCPGLMRKMDLTKEMLPLAIQFMLELDDDESWELHEGQEEDEECETYTIGEEAVYRIGSAIGGNTVLPVMEGMLGGLLGSEDWRQRHAALMALCQITEGCAKQLAASAQSLVETVLGRFGDPHPRVRYAAVHTIGYLCSDFDSVIQTHFHEVVLGNISVLMDDASVRVAAHAAAAITNFCQELVEESASKKQVIAPFVQDLLGKLHVQMQSPRKISIDCAIVAVASIATIVGAEFASFYDLFMPFLKQIVSSAPAQMGMIRAKAIECISLIAIAVGKEQFAADANEVMEHMASTAVAPDDPQAEYITKAWPRLCQCLGQDFVPYLEHVVPGLLASAQKKCDITFTDVDEGENDEYQNLQIGDKMLGIRTADMEEKNNACSALARIVEALQEGFYPYIEQGVTTMMPLLKFYYHDGVRMAASYAMPEFVKCAKKYADANGGDYATMAQLASVISANLQEVLPDEPDVEVQCSYLQALRETIEIADTALGTEAAHSFLQILPKLWEEVQERITQRQTAKQNEDCDEEEWEAMQEQNKNDDEVIDGIAQVIGQFLKTHKEAFLEAFASSGVLETFSQMLGSEVVVHRKVAMWVWTDLVEHCPDAAAQSLETFLPALLNYTDPAQPSDVRSAAAYGLGVCADKLGDAMKPHVGDATSRLMGLVGTEGARSEDNEDATDNAICALGKICLKHSDVTDVSAVLPAWLEYQPLQGDLEEAAVCQIQLCELLEGSSAQLVLGAANEHVLKVAQVIAHGLAEEQYTNEAAAQQLRGYYETVKAQLPADQQAQLLM